MAAGQENCSRITRSSLKRGPQAMGFTEPANKKRVVLGEITNLGDSEAAKSKCQQQQQQQQSNKRSKKCLDENKGADSFGKADDPQMCAAYVDNIYDYLHQMEMEAKRRPISDYVEKVQKDVSVNMRAILVDWLIEVSEEYNLLSDTLHSTVSYVDRYLSVNVVSRQNLQLLGVASMLIASKYEEISPPNVDDFCYITDNTYKREDLVKMEADVLTTLKFEMGNPTVKTFLRRYHTTQENHNNPDLQLEFFGYYLAELSLLDYECLRFLPSLVAASVIFLARFTITPSSHPWNSALQQLSGYKPADLKECVLILHDLQMSRRAGSLEAVRDKYNMFKFKFVSAAFCPLEEIPNVFFNDVEECLSRIRVE